jgi:hypothetical protein
LSSSRWSIFYPFSPLRAGDAGNEQVAEKWPSAALSARLTISAAWQKVAPYSSRRHSQDCLPDRQVKSAAGALQLALLSNLEKMTFSAAY